MPQSDRIPIAVSQYSELLQTKTGQRNQQRAVVAKRLVSDPRLHTLYADVFFRPWGGSETLWRLWMDAAVEATIERVNGSRTSREQLKRQQFLIGKLETALPDVVAMLIELNELERWGAPIALPEELSNQDTLANLASLADAVDLFGDEIRAEDEHEAKGTKSYFARRVDGYLLASQKHTPVRSFVIRFDEAMAFQKGTFRALTGYAALGVARLPDEVLARLYLISTGQPPANPKYPDDEIFDIARRVNTHRLPNDIFC